MAELIIKDLVAGYGNVSVLHNVSLEVEEGSIVALLGTNGNGKSTLMRCVAGLIKPTAGSITFKDEGAEIDLISDSPKQIVDHGIALVPEGRRLFPLLTVEQNLMLGAYRKAARENG